MYSSRTCPRKDWLGRRLDLRAYHRDPTCETHRDPLSPCSSHRIFHGWDWVVDWVTYLTFLGGVALTMYLVATLALGR